MTNRVVITVTAALMLASCGSSSNESQQPSVTVRLSDQENGSLNEAGDRAPSTVAGTQAAPFQANDSGMIIRVKHPSGATVVLRLISADVAPAIEALEQNGFVCKSPATANILEQQDGKRLPIMKVDCASGGSYQLTMMNDQIYIKPWTGTILGM
jgi:hypothetical protein